jgi:4-carboxymuconolactone decarboxylase
VAPEPYARSSKGYETEATPGHGRRRVRTRNDDDHPATTGNGDPMSAEPENRRGAGLEVLRTMNNDLSADVTTLSAQLPTPLAELLVDFCLGDLWTRPTLDRKTRSLIVLAALTALGEPQALATHVRGARTHGATDDEINEVFIHLSGYVGFPRATAAARIAREVLET